MTVTGKIIEQLRAAGCVFAEDEARLLLDAATTPDGLTAMVQRRVGGEPLEQILGWAEFSGLRVAVEPGVFVPRQRSALLVREAASLAPQHPVVLDLCCGSGALGAALAATVGPMELYAADIDPAAVRCARRNVPGAVLQGDLFEPVPDQVRGGVDILLANVPYVPAAAIASLPPEAREHEPRAALDGGTDGLDVLRRVSAGAADWLAPGGHVLSETGTAQASMGAAILTGDGLAGEVVHDAESGATIVVGTRSS